MKNRTVVLSGLCATALAALLLTACTQSSTTGQGSGTSSAQPAGLAAAPVMGTTGQGSSSPVTKAVTNIRTDASRAKVRQAKRAKSKPARVKSAQRPNPVKSAQSPDMFQ